MTDDTKTVPLPGENTKSLANQDNVALVDKTTLDINEIQQFIPHRYPAIARFHPESFREVMSVDDQARATRGDQVIKRKSHQRFAEDRHERFRQFVRERAQPCAEPGAENESLRDGGQ